MKIQVTNSISFQSIQQLTSLLSTIVPDSNSTHQTTVTTHKTALQICFKSSASANPSCQVDADHDPRSRSAIVYQTINALTYELVNSQLITPAPHFNAETETIITYNSNGVQLFNRMKTEDI